MVMEMKSELSEQELIEELEKITEQDSTEFLQQMFVGSRRANKAYFQRKSLQHALMLGADVTECEYGYLIDFSGDTDNE